MISPAAWRGLYEGNMHQLFQAFHFLSNANVEPDEMHVVHIGTSQYALGSVLFLLVFEILPGRPLQSMEALWLEICAEYRASGTTAQFSSLGLSSFCDTESPHGSYPRLKGRAAEIKWLVPVLQVIWRRHRRPGHDVDGLVGSLLDNQVRFQNLLDEDATDFQMEPGRARELCEVTDLVVGTYCRLAAAADRDGKLLWSVVPKHHMLWHFARKAKWLHPRRGACYQDEDFMGTVKALVEGCTRAIPLHKVASTVLTKYRWGMYFQYLQTSEA